MNYSYRAHIVFSLLIKFSSRFTFHSSSNGEAWAKQRNVLSKRIMRPLELAKFTGTMNEVSQELIGKLRQIRHGEGGGGVDDDSNALIVEELEDELSKWAMECKLI